MLHCMCVLVDFTQVELNAWMVVPVSDSWWYTQSVTVKCTTVHMLTVHLMDHHACIDVRVFRSLPTYKHANPDKTVLCLAVLLVLYFKHFYEIIYIPLPFCHWVILSTFPLLFLFPCCCLSVYWTILQRGGILWAQAWLSIWIGLQGERTREHVSILCGLLRLLHLYCISLFLQGRKPRGKKRKHSGQGELVFFLWPVFKNFSSEKLKKVMSQWKKKS